VFWVGDKAIGGKMFALIDLSGGLAHGVGMFSAGPERFAELVEHALRNTEWEEGWVAAHQITLNKLPKRVRETLAMPAKAQAKLLADRRTVLAEKACVEEPAKKKR